MEQKLVQYLDRFRELLAKGDITGALAVLEDLHPADQADLVEEMIPANKVLVITNLDPEVSADVLEEMEDEDIAGIAKGLQIDYLAPIIQEMETDEAVDILYQLPPDLAEVALEVIEETQELEHLLKYPPDTAGGLMTTEVVTILPDWTVSDTLDALRMLGPQTDSLYYLFVTTEEGKLVGLVPLRILVALEADEVIRDVMVENVISVDPYRDKEDCARMLSHYGFMALPVVDEDETFLGVITADDLIEVAEDEATEDMLRMAGIIADGEGRVFGPISTSILNRLPWLAINILTLLIAVSVIDLFEDLIAGLVVLAVFLPIVSGEGGNAGSQTVTVIIRGLALNEINISDTKKALIREVIVSFANGALIGLGTGAVAYLWKGNFLISVAIFLAMIFNFVMAALTGVLVPMALKKMNIDPALASAAFVTGFTDTFGFLFFLGIVTLLV